METTVYKRKILEGKLELLQLQEEKMILAKAQKYDEASRLRDREKELKQHLSELQLEIINAISEFSLQEDNINNYLELHELLLEFHPIDIRIDVEGTIHPIPVKDCVHFYWKLRQEMYYNFKTFVENEYQSLRDQRNEFLSTGNNEASTLALRKLQGLSEFLLRFR